VNRVTPPRARERLDTEAAIAYNIEAETGPLTVRLPLPFVGPARSAGLRAWRGTVRPLG
jgi:hypothetical protein